jgi:hypothetical protein
MFDPAANVAAYAGIFNNAALNAGAAARQNALAGYSQQYLTDPEGAQNALIARGWWGDADTMQKRQDARNLADAQKKAADFYSQGKIREANAALIGAGQPGQAGTLTNVWATQNNQGNTAEDRTREAEQRKYTEFATTMRYADTPEKWGALVEAVAPHHPEIRNFADFNTGRPMLMGKAGVTPADVAPPQATGVVKAPPEVTGDALLNWMDTNGHPQVANELRALKEGRMQMPGSFALKSPYWQNRIELLAQLDPSFDMVNFGARAASRKDFTSGKSAQNITSFNTAIGHLGTLDEAIDGLHNTASPTWNAVANAVSARNPYDTNFQAAQKRFAAAKQAVVDELTRAFRGSGGNVHDIRGWEETINQADSPQAAHAAVKQAVELLDSRIQSVADQYNRGMGTTSDRLDLLSPKAKATVQRLIGEAPQAGGGNAASAGVSKPLTQDIANEAARLIQGGNNPAEVIGHLKKKGYDVKPLEDAINGR